jgi:hypothetical protein
MVVINLLPKTRSLWILQLPTTIKSVVIVVSIAGAILLCCHFILVEKIAVVVNQNASLKQQLDSLPIADTTVAAAAYKQLADVITKINSLKKQRDKLGVLFNRMHQASALDFFLTQLIVEHNLAKIFGSSEQLRAIASLIKKLSLINNSALQKVEKSGDNYDFTLLVPL